MIQWLAHNTKIHSFLAPTGVMRKTSRTHQQINRFKHSSHWEQSKSTALCVQIYKQRSHEGLENKLGCITNPFSPIPLKYSIRKPVKIYKILKLAHTLKERFQHADCHPLASLQRHYKWHKTNKAVRRKKAAELSILVAIGDGHPSDRSCVTAQEEEGHVTGTGDQVDQHGHSNRSQSRQVQLLHQQTSQEYSQTGTRDGRHPCLWREYPQNYVLHKVELCPFIFVLFFVLQMSINCFCCIPHL